MAHGKGEQYHFACSTARLATRAEPVRTFRTSLTGSGGGAGAREMAHMNENRMNPGREFRGAGSSVRRAIVRACDPMCRACCRRTALAAWLDTGLPSRSQEFDPLRPFQRRHHLIAGRVRGMSLRGAGHGACSPTDEWQNSSPDRSAFQRGWAHPRTGDDLP